MEDRVEGGDLLHQAISQFLAGHDRQGRNIVDGLFGVKLGALATGSVKDVDEVSFQVEQAQLEYIEQAARPRTNDDDIRFMAGEIASGSTRSGKGIHMHDVAPVRPQDCTSMKEVRAGVDALDRQIVKLIAERSRYMQAAARIKPSRDVVRDQARIDDVLAKVGAAADAANLPRQIAEPVWRELVEQSIAYEFEIWDATRG